eukprot:m.87241 g.87241  ORF g.87241 m.87241 type:complete len:197 (+) comp15124_c6_seq2:214-804(+)
MRSTTRRKVSRMRMRRRKTQTVAATTTRRKDQPCAAASQHHSNSNSNSLLVEVITEQKTPTRLPEALFLRVQPTSPADTQWRVHKLESLVDPYDVVTGGSKTMHSASPFDGVHLCTDADVGAGNCWTLLPLDAALIKFGAPSGFPVPLTSPPDPAEGVSFILADNIWNTNYPMWVPFAAGEESLSARFLLQPQQQQ